MSLPAKLRALTPDWLRDNPRVRAIMYGTGLIPPRPMHSGREATLLMALARDADCVVELGVYEGSSASLFCQVLGPAARLVLVDPFEDPSGTALRPGHRASPAATRRAVARWARSGGPTVDWYIARSQDVGRRYPGPPCDLVFIDGEHSEEGAREDWDVWHSHVSPGGAVAFHDARLDKPQGGGHPGPTAVVDALFRNAPPDGWTLERELDTLVVVRRRV
ncbi:MAG: class I SAM-dependent methyltransferase [Solirubrobacterales bacterium]|nr:class I SAM-dependent methyltransferase [Solirubrobacterales bacterium]